MNALAICINQIGADGAFTRLQYHPRCAIVMRSYEFIDLCVRGWEHAELRMESLARSCALNPGSVTAAPCIVHLQVAGLRVGEESLEHCRSLSAFTDFGIDHHVLRVEGADSQKPRRKYFWDGVDSLEGLISDLANVDGMRRAIWRICRLVLEIEK